MPEAAFHKKVVVVTGAGQGIGRAIAEAFLRAGATVVLAETNEASGRETERALAALGPVSFVPTDVGREDAVAALIAAVIEQFHAIDVVVNNAAIAAPGPVTELEVQAWRRVLDVNLTGPMLLAKHAAPHLAARRGAIVNIASTRALMSEANTEAYSATKAGLVGLTHALAVSLGPQVRVNCVSPGWIDTGPYARPPRGQFEGLSGADHEQHPAGRAGHPGDIAAMVLYLAGAEAGFITGQNFVVDGGMTKKMIYAE